MENDNTDGQGQEMPEEFANLLTEIQGDNSNADMPEMPEKFGELDRPSFEKLLEEASGGAIKDFGGFRQAITAQEKYAELQQKLSQTEQQLQLNSGGPKYANDFVKKVDEFYRNGVPEEQIKEFIRVQELNVDELSDADVLKTMYKREYPTLTNDELDQLIEDEFGDLDGIGGTKLKKAALDGRKKLSEMKVNLSEPEHLRMQKAAQQEAESRMKNWHQLTKTVYENKEQHQFSIPVGEDNVSLNFTVPKEFRQTLSFELAKYATMNKIPATKEGLAALNDFAERSIFFRYGKEIMATMFRDTQAGTKNEVLSKVHNVEITRNGNGGQQTSVKKTLSKAEEQMSRLAKEGMQGKWR